MENKHKAFSIAMFITLLTITSLSFFMESVIFTGTIQVITIPILLFVTINIISALFDEVSNKCKKECDVLKLKLDVYSNQIKWLEWLKERQLSILKDDKNEIIIRIDKDLAEEEDKMLGVLKDIAINSALSYSTSHNKIIFVLYTMFLVMIFLGLFLSPIISPYFEKVPFTALSFVGLTLTVGEILLKEPFAQMIYNTKIVKQRAKLEKQLKDEEWYKSIIK